MSNPDIHRTKDLGVAALCVCFYGQDTLIGIDRGEKTSGGNTFITRVPNIEYQAFLSDYSKGVQPIEDAKAYVDSVKFVLSKQATMTAQWKQFGATEWRPLEYVGVNLD